MVGGPEHSTLPNDAFPSRQFDFMLAKSPYGKSWKSDQERMGGKTGVRDPLLTIEHAGDPEHSSVTRCSDGQMLYASGGRVLRNGWPDWPECPAEAGRDSESVYRGVLRFARERQARLQRRREALGGL